jgi:hypothetical protein
LLNSILSHLTGLTRTQVKQFAALDKIADWPPPRKGIIAAVAAFG